MISDKQLKRWFCKYNNQFFDSTLPDVLIYWEPPTASYAEICPVFDTGVGFEIKIDPSIKGFHKMWKLTLLHEMCHLKLWPKHPRSMHGKLFQEEMKRLANANAFKTLW